MLLVDNIIIGLVLISVLIGLFRGFIPEVMSIAVWIVSVWLAWQYADVVSVRLEDKIDSPALLLWLSRAIVFAGGLIGGGLLTAVVSLLVEKSGLSGTDRVLGMAFGLVRGVLVFGVLVVFARVLDLQQETWWTQSRLIPYGERVGGWILSVLPDEVAEFLPEAAREVEEQAGELPALPIPEPN
jgi:membrane protein required for colicin V production